MESSSITTVSLNSNEAEGKGSCPEVDMVRALTCLWVEIMHIEHGSVRAMMDSQGAVVYIAHGMDTKGLASLKCAQFYAKDVVSSGLVWIDYVPGIHNPANILTKALGHHGWI